MALIAPQVTTQEHTLLCLGSFFFTLIYIYLFSQTVCFLSYTVYIKCQCTVLLKGCRAATNDYFDNRLAGRLFFRLIGLNKMILCY